MKACRALQLLLEFMQQVMILWLPHVSLHVQQWCFSMELPLILRISQHSIHWYTKVESKLSDFGKVLEAPGSLQAHAWHANDCRCTSWMVAAT